MSLLPHLLSDAFLRPSRLMDQHFGMTLDPEDLLEPITVPRYRYCPMGYRYSPMGYSRNWRSAASQQDTGSTVNYGKDGFTAILDVQQFKPEEISVKITGENTVTVEGKHEEKEDEHGLIFRHFVRKYAIPKNYDISKIESKLSSDGVLSVVAPKLDSEEFESKDIPIAQTGEPAKTVEKKGDGDKK